MAKPIITVEQLKENLSYDPETGIFTRLQSANQNSQLGQRAGFVSGARNEYRSIGLLGRQYREHRLAWLYVYGEWPKGDIDHINGIGSDNRIANLRDVSTAENMQNLKGAKSNSTSGLLGARNAKGKWQSAIKVGDKYKFLGTFETPEEAHEAYINAKRKYHPMNTL